MAFTRRLTGGHHVGGFHRARFRGFRCGGFARGGAAFLATTDVVFFFVTVVAVFFLVLDLLTVFFFLRSLPFTGSDFCAVGVLACPVACANGVKDNDVNNNAQSVNDHFFICATEQPSEYAG